MEEDTGWGGLDGVGRTVEILIAYNYFGTSEKKSGSLGVNMQSLRARERQILREGLLQRGKGA